MEQTGVLEPAAAGDKPVSPRVFKTAMAEAGPYVAALAIVLLTTALAEVVFRTFGTNKLSMIFLLGVVLTAIRYGAYPAYFAAGAAFMFYNFDMVTPRFTIRFASAEDVITLIVFFVVAMLTGGLAGRLRDEAVKSKAQAQTTDALFNASRDLSSRGDPDDLRAQLVSHVATAVGGEAVLTDGARTWRAAAPRGDSPPPPTPPEWRARQVQADGTELGLLEWRPTGAGGQAMISDERLIEVLIDLGAAAIMRAQLTEARSEVEALAKTEQLRTALLSSISHDLRTPLSAILVSASSLHDYGDRFDSKVRTDLALTIREESRRLNRYVENLLNITKLESGALVIGAVAVDLADVVREVGRLYERRNTTRKIGIEIEQEGLAVTGDQVLLEQALGNLVENALRFAPEGSTVVLRTARRNGAAVIEVLDEGPGVPPKDIERIFEKFFRSSATAPHLQGSGLGLSIAKGLTEAMGGEISAHARDDGRPGLCVVISLPERVEHG